MTQLKTGAHVHLIGICGTAMASLAGLLQSRGYKVTGSDSNPYPPMSTQLEKLGISIQKPYSEKNLHPVPDFVVVGNVISKNNSEAEELMRLKIPYCSLPQAMGEWIIDQKQSLVVAGTHGKTTTTSILAWVLESAGKNPGFLIGGIPKNFSQSFRDTDSDFFVIEGDEYDTAFFDKVPKFVHYKPLHVILTSIEFDHADIYRDLAHVKEAFAQLMRMIPAHGTLIYCADDENIRDLLPLCRAQKIGYGKSAQADWRLGKVAGLEGRSIFTVASPKGEVQVQTTLSGAYNFLNVISVLALCDVLKVDPALVQKGIMTFQGVKRRQEILGEPRGILVIEDFAHHPTAVRETLQGLQQRYPGRRLFSVFEPRSATSRRKIFQSEYAQAFSGSHQVLIAEAFDQSKIDEQDRFSSEQLVEDLNERGSSAKVFGKVEEAVSLLQSSTKPGDLIVIMSNGGFDGIYTKLLKALA